MNQTLNKHENLVREAENADLRETVHFMQKDARFGVESLQNANAERYGALPEGPVLSEETVNCERYGALRNGNFIVNPILLECKR